MITKFFERLNELFAELVYGWKTFRGKSRLVDVFSKIVLWFVRWFDWIAILSGVFALLFIFLGLIEKEQSWVDNWVFVNGAICVLYLLYAIGLLLFNTVEFDWHLINGNFLRKVICLVVLVPFLITSVLVLCDYKGWQRDLIYQDGMYHQDSPDCNGVHENQKDPSLLWTVYYHFIDPGNQHTASTDQGRNWAALIAILGVFLLNGLLVSSIVGWVDKRKERWLNGEETYCGFLKRRKHYVIIGGSDMVVGIVKEIFKKEEKKHCLPYILIQTSQDVEDFRRKLFSDLKTKEQKHIIIHYGNRNSESDIKQLHLKKASELYIIGEESRTDDMESYHDTMNMKCLDLVCQEVEKISHFKKIENENKETISDNRLLCRFMFEYQTTFNVFQYSEISDRIKERINFKPFHYYEMWAQNVLVQNPLRKDPRYDYLPLEGKSEIKKDSEEYVHLVVVGMTRMGTALATQAALMAHYPNFDEKKIRTKITFIDENADKEKNFYIDRYDRLFALSNWSYKEMVRSESGVDKLETVFTHTPVEYDYLGGDFLDVEWEFIQGTVAQLKLQKYIEECAIKSKKMTIAICKDEPSRCLAAALNLEWRIFKNVNQVLVYNRYDDALVEQLNPKRKEESESPSENKPMEERTEQEKKKDVFSPFGDKLKAFGMAKYCYNSELLKDSEFVADELYKVYKETKKRLEGSDSENNESKYPKPSQIAGYWSNIYQASTIWTKLRCMDESNEDTESDNVDIFAKVEHNRWNMEKLIMSFRHLTVEEQNEVIKDPDEKEVKKREMSHFDICSNERLREIYDDLKGKTENVVEFDESYVKAYLNIKQNYIRYKNDGSRDNSTAC